LLAPKDNANKLAHYMLLLLLIANNELDSVALVVTDRTPGQLGKVIDIAYTLHKSLAHKRKKTLEL